MTKDEMVGWHHRLNGHEFARVAGAATPGSPHLAHLDRLLQGLHHLHALVLHGQGEEDSYGVEHLLAEGAAEEDEGVHVQQVFLQVVHRCELLVTALANDAVARHPGWNLSSIIYWL